MITVKDVMDALQVSDQTVRRYIKDKKLKARKVGRKYLIPREALDALVLPKEDDLEADGLGGAATV